MSLFKFVVKLRIFQLSILLIIFIFEHRAKPIFSENHTFESQLLNFWSYKNPSNLQRIFNFSGLFNVCLSQLEAILHTYQKPERVKWKLTCSKRYANDNFTVKRKKVEECWEFENNPGVLKRCAFLNRETERGAKLSIPNWFEANFTWEKNTKNS